MLAAVTHHLKRRRRIVLLVLTAVALVLVWHQRLSDAGVRVAVLDGFQSLTSRLEFAYLAAQPQVNASRAALLLDTRGYRLERQRVAFKYLGNGGDTAKDPELALRDNTAVYDATMAAPVSEPKDFALDLIRPPEDPLQYARANATILLLVRNEEAASIGLAIRRFEKRFNRKFRYPYTFVNDQPFTDRFKEKMRRLLDADMEFVTIPAALWDKPDSIDTTREQKAMAKMEQDNIAYAQKGSYHNMCRFYLGNFYHVPELQKYRYYWRVEPNVDFYTDLDYDVFKYMAATKKKYGFTINLYDIHQTVASLWPETLKWLNTGDNYRHVNPNGAFQWLLYPEQHPEKARYTGGYLTCHFWSNFEIADMDFFRLEAYQSWFNHLDRTGNFYYERWGDAPVHLIGVALFADAKKDVHWFRDLGYFHDPYYHCPRGDRVSGCKAGKFSKWDHLNDQNCMGTWIQQYGDELGLVFA